MVKISDCSCECRDKGKEKMIEERALSSVSKIISTEGAPYYPDGTGAITMPIADASTVLNAQKVPGIEGEIKQMKISAAETDEAVTVLEGTVDNHAREIAALKATEGTQGETVNDLSVRMTAVEGKAAANTADIMEIQQTYTAQGQQIAANTSRIAAVETKASANTTEIAAIKQTDNAQGQQIAALQTLTNSITKSLITSVEVKDGTDSGSFMVNVVEEDGTKRTSNNFQYGRVGSFELLQGTQAGYVKGKLTLVDGTEITSNDFQILQVTATDVYVTAITLQADYQTGKIGGTIGYSNGNTVAIDSILVPTAPGVTSNIESLLTRMTAVEKASTTQSNDISGLKTRMNTAERDITNLETRVTAAEEVNTTQNSDITALKGRVTSAETNITGLKTRVTNVETKSTAQDGEIENLQTRVAAIEQTPGVGVFTNSKSGTILGSTTDGKISANSDGTGSVNGWSGKASQSDLTALQNGVKNCFEGVDYTPATNTLTLTTLGGQSSGITLDKNWGTANAGKLLGIGNDGAVTPVDGSSSKEWIEITSFSSIDRSKITINSEILFSSGKTADESYRVRSCYCHCIYTSTATNSAGFTSSGYAYDSSSNYPVVDFTITNTSLNFGILKNNTRTEIRITGSFRLFIHY